MIERLIKNGVNFIWVDTFDIERLTSILTSKKKEKVCFYIWDYRNGLMINGVKVKNTNTFASAIEFIIGYKYKCVFLFNDAHLFISDKKQIIPLFRELKKSIEGKQINVIFSGDASSIPNEIRDLFVVTKLPQMSPEEIKKILKVNNVNDYQSLTLNELKNIALIGGDINEAKELTVLKSKALQKIDKLVSIDEIGGLTEIKQWISKIKKLTNSNLLRGCLISGISGTGKTTIAKVIASEFNLPLYRCDVSMLFNPLIGQTEQNTSLLLENIKSVSPCVLLIDEIEKTLAGVESSGISDGGVVARLVANLLYFLQERDFFVYIVATSNNTAMLPPELTRAGRWDCMFELKYPDKNDRIEIALIHLSKYTKSKNNKSLAEYIADKCINYTGADIEAVIKNAVILAFAENEELSTKHVGEALKMVIPVFKCVEKTRS